MFPRACDCHVHVFDPQRFPYVPGRTYTPGPADVDRLSAMHARIGVQRAVLVQPSVYGTDNTCMLAALRALGPDRARGIAVIDLDATDLRQLRQLHEAGIRGVRLNLEVRGEADVSAAAVQLAKARRVADLPGWCVQVYANAALVQALAGELDGFPVPVVLDHFGGIQRPESQAAQVRMLADLMRSGNVVVKASAPYKLEPADARFTAAMSLTRTLFDAAPTQLVWGSDWPHTGGGVGRRKNPFAVEPFRWVDDAQVVAEVSGWIASDEARHQLFVANPQRLYWADQ